MEYTGTLKAHIPFLHVAQRDQVIMPCSINVYNYTSIKILYSLSPLCFFSSSFYIFLLVSNLCFLSFFFKKSPQILIFFLLEYMTQYGKIQRNGFLGEGTCCCPARRPEFDPQSLHDGKRKATLTSCPLISTHHWSVIQ